MQPQTACIKSFILGLFQLDHSEAVHASLSPSLSLSLSLWIGCHPDNTDAKIDQEILAESKVCNALTEHFLFYFILCVHFLRPCFDHVRTIRSRSRVLNAMHKQAVCEGPHSNSVGFLLHNTMAYVTTIAGTIKPFRCVRLSKFSHKHASASDLSQCKRPAVCYKSGSMQDSCVDKHWRLW